jgi:hypothetical protein
MPSKKRNRHQSYNQEDSTNVKIQAIVFLNNLCLQYLLCLIRIRIKKLIEVVNNIVEWVGIADTISVGNYNIIVVGFCNVVTDTFAILQ